MVDEIEIMLILLGIVGVLAVLAERVRFPFPIMMVLGGIVIALIPRLPAVTLEPDLVLVVFLPPIVYSAAYAFPWPEFRSNLRAILLLAVGLVFATMTSIAVTAYWLIPGITLAAGFVLGAIVSPPDAAAAGAVLKNVRIPPRLANVLEGESLVNDASGLVAYSLAVLAVTTGTFSLIGATGDFIWVSVGGVAVGLVIGWIATYLHAQIQDPPIAITLQILTPYAAYLPADHLGVSGVLSAVTAGLYVGHRSNMILSPKTRLQGEAIWGFLNYFINGTLFIMIGLQLPEIIQRLDAFRWWELAIYAGLVSGVTILVRFAWIFGSAWIVRKRPSEDSFNLSNGVLTVTSWAGMRGAVSLAAALAIPMQIQTGEPFPQRDLIIFLTYCVIFSTLVLQGFTLPWVIRKAGVTGDGQAGIREAKARTMLLRESLALIDAEAAEDPVIDSNVSHRMLRELYQTRLDHMNMRLGLPLASHGDLTRERAFVSRMFAYGRNRVIQLRNEGVIDEEIRRRITRDIDNEEMRMLRVLADE